MFVCAYVDSLGNTEEEYADIKSFLELELEWSFGYKTGVRPSDMLQQSADVYVLDYGGVQIGYGDGGYSFYRDKVIRLVEERPNLLILMWSSFTGYGYFTTVKEERPDLALAPNVVFCDGACRLGVGRGRYNDEWQKRAKAWVSGGMRRRTTREILMDILPSSMTGTTVDELLKIVRNVKPATVRRVLRSMQKDGLVAERCEGRFARR